ncbi:hypothetical protein DICPUDRAFT_83328 [Dictyostelium purpureum]|uniref:Leucine-rich repeat containing protein n=1 Tax=Dictyostelium purpureum TaxID=5786 RepID=F0ZZ78_DICPU|nr:uncharacterized protein DICPUDRAFT_83328 [Dictyostelium purpureum]EGC30756.1 hypothetical protein DICPUDRAFT_83328 [Dictyostelium purpureum]|eukprot:XP_003292717.1 hypothetical protein DICPUDRAFT_83328 [Dictyostelium purpureum]
MKDKIINNTYNFNLVWSNIFLRKKILFFLRVFKIFNYQRVFHSIDSFRNYKFKPFLNRLVLENYTLNENVSLESLPMNIESLLLGSYTFRVIPQWLKSLDMEYQRIETLMQIFNSSPAIKLERLRLYKNWEINEQELPPNLLPPSLTCLKLDPYGYQIRKGVLPPNLKQLDIKFIESPTLCDCFETDSLPKSLLMLRVFNKQVTLNTSILPDSLEELFFPFNCDIQLTNNFEQISFPNSLSKLTLAINQFNDIKLPDNLKEFNLFTKSELDENIIESIALPCSLQLLNIHSSTKQSQLW